MGASKVTGGQPSGFGLLALASQGFPAVLRLSAPLANSLRELRSLRSTSRQRVRARSALRARAESLPLLGCATHPAGRPPAPLPRRSGIGDRAVFGIPVRVPPRVLARRA